MIVACFMFGLWPDVEWQSDKMRIFMPRLG